MRQNLTIFPILTKSSKQFLLNYIGIFNSKGMAGSAMHLSNKQKDCLSILSILSVILIRFYKTIIFGQTISKAYLIAHWDSLLYPFKLGQSLCTDPSLCQLFIPNIFFIAEYWRHALPLWNPLNGLGIPILADPQAFVFSPLYLPFDFFPSFHTWDVITMLKMAIGSISIYLLCRELRLNFMAGIIAALSFIFCPWMQWELELMGKGSNFLPLVILCFTKLAKKSSVLNIVLGSCVCAIDILCSHPEISFITILFSVGWTFFIAYYCNKEHHTLRSICTRTLLTLLIVGLLAFALVSPMLIPFIEYTRNAESYKLDVVASTGLPWQAIFADFLFPFHLKGSLYFGSLSLWGLITAIFFQKELKNQLVRPLLICLIFSIMAVTRPFPFEYLFKLPPLSMTFATYWLPEYLLFISILTGLGCSLLINLLFTNTFKEHPRRLLIVSILGIILLVIPLIYTPWHNNPTTLIFDNTFALARFNWKIWVSSVSIATASLAILFFSTNKPLPWKIFASILFIAGNLINLLFISASSLPIRPNFEYPKSLNLSPINAHTDRIVSIGNHLLKPNTNLIYKLPLLEFTNPIFPKRFVSFTQACGAEIDQYNQIFSPVLSPLLRIAGVNRIISEQPVLDESLFNKFSAQTKTMACNYENISLNKVQLFHDNKSSTIFLKAKAKLNSYAKSAFHLCFLLEDLKGNSLFYTEPLYISSSPKEQIIFSSALIPKGITDWKVGIRLMQDTDNVFLKPQSASFGNIRPDSSWIIATAKDQEYLTKINDKRFKLIAQHGGILEYSDTTAFKRYFFTSKISWVKNNKEALLYLKTNTDKLQDTAVLENEQKQSFQTIIKNIHSLDNIDFDKSAILKITDTNKSIFDTATNVSLEVESKTPAYLVASEIYYPGWNAYIDGVQTEIFRTDYLLRGIIIPAGKHAVKFIYQPISVFVGICLFMISACTICILLLRNFSKQAKS